MVEEVDNSDLLDRIDRAPTNRFHVKAIIVSGMGFFTDAYILFITATALPIIAAYFGISGANNMFGASTFLGLPATEFEIGLIGSMALFGAFVGAIIFGIIGDKLGRKYAYGMEMMVLVIFTVISAFSINPLMLMISRFILGIGVGGDYPISSTIMSEYSNIKSRGKLVQSVFAMQGFGLLAGAVVGLVSIHTMPLYYAWRVMLGVGAIPAASVIYLRRKIRETPRYSIEIKGNVNEGAKAVADVVGSSNFNNATESRSVNSKGVTLRKYAMMLVATAGSWFLFDMAFYGTTVNNGTILSAMGFSSGATLVSQIGQIAVGNVILALAFAIPGYWIAFALIDRTGRKFLQWTGFSVMAVVYFIFALDFIGLKHDVFLLLALYGVSYLFANIGPNSTTFILPTELFPTKIRSTAHGISASAGKLGAGLFALLEPVLAVLYGLKSIFTLLTVFSVIGVILTLTVIRETKGLSLESASALREPNSEVRPRSTLGKI